MPLLSFSGWPARGPFYKLILDQEKNQTVRRPRKNPIKVGDTLYLYWKVRKPIDDKDIHKIGTATCTSVETKTYSQFAFDYDFARADGFEDCEELRQWFGDADPLEVFKVIQWGDLSFDCPKCKTLCDSSTIYDCEQLKCPACHMTFIPHEELRE